MSAARGTKSLRVVVVVLVLSSLIVFVLSWGWIRSEVGPLFGLGPPGDRVDMCGMAHPADVTVTQIDVYNFDSRSDHADHHQVPQDLVKSVCANDLAFLSASTQLDSEDLQGVPVTVFVLTWSDTPDAPRNPIYVYWLKHKRGVAVQDLGVTYYVPNGTLTPYYAAEAETIPRWEVPPR